MVDALVRCLWVGLGGCIGSVARYGVSVAAQRLPMAWPVGTLTANVLGCLIIGVIMGIAPRDTLLPPNMRLFLATGFCGGFTTMSSMVYETAGMVRISEYGQAGLYAVGTLVFSMTAFFAGVVLVRVLVKMGGGVWS